MTLYLSFDSNKVQLFLFFIFSYIESDVFEHSNKDLQQIMYNDDDDDDDVIAQSVQLTSFFEFFFT